MLVAIKQLLNIEISAEQLMLSYQASGKSKELELLVNRHGDELYHYLMTQCDHHMALDICQKTWLKVIEKRHLYQDHGSFKAWLFVIARRLLLDEIRYYSRLEELEQQTITSIVLSEDTQTLQQRFERALEQLPFSQKEAFVLQQEGFSLAQIAQITAHPVETIKTRLRYAKSALRTQLGEFNVR